MLSAVLLCALAQVHAVALDPVPACSTCDALTARVASLEAQLAARTVAEPVVRRVRLIEVQQPVRTVVNYTGPITDPVVTYTAPLGAALPSLAAWAPGSYSSSTYVERRGLFGGRFFGGRFASVSACGPGGCP